MTEYTPHNWVVLKITYGEEVNIKSWAVGLAVILMAILGG